MAENSVNPVSTPRATLVLSPLRVQAILNIDKGEATQARERIVARARDPFGPRRRRKAAAALCDAAANTQRIDIKRYYLREGAQISTSSVRHVVLGCSSGEIAEAYLETEEGKTWFGAIAYRQDRNAARPDDTVMESFKTELLSYAYEWYNDRNNNPQWLLQLFESVKQSSSMSLVNMYASGYRTVLARLDQLESLANLFASMGLSSDFIEMLRLERLLGRVVEWPCSAKLSDVLTFLETHKITPGIHITTGCWLAEVADALARESGSPENPAFDEIELAILDMAERGTMVSLADLLLLRFSSTRGDRARKGRAMASLDRIISDTNMQVALAENLMSKHPDGWKAIDIASSRSGAEVSELDLLGRALSSTYDLQTTDCNDAGMKVADSMDRYLLATCAKQRRQVAEKIKGVYRDEENVVAIEADHDRITIWTHSYPELHRALIPDPRRYLSSRKRVDEFMLVIREQLARLLMQAEELKWSQFRQAAVEEDNASIETRMASDRKSLDRLVVSEALVLALQRKVQWAASNHSTCLLNRFAEQGLIPRESKPEEASLLIDDSVTAEVAVCCTDDNQYQLHTCIGDWGWAAANCISSKEHFYKRGVPIHVPLEGPVTTDEMAVMCKSVAEVAGSQN